jgi:hypothetical protein
MDANGQHEVIYGEYGYQYKYLANVNANDARDITRLLKELNSASAALDFREQKTYVWGFQTLNPVKYSSFKLELWNC